jgi:5-methylcytosine-specific restriction protein B
MSFADDVREHCRIHYVEPARARGESTVEIRAGDVHSALGYSLLVGLAALDPPYF